MRITLAAALLASCLAATLAGCNRDGGNAQNSGLPTPGARPGNNSSADPNSEQAFRQSYRSINIETCISAARTRAQRERNSALGMDFRPYCTCSVDRLMANRSVEELTRLQPGPREQAIAQECGREHGMLIDGGPSSGGDTSSDPGIAPADDTDGSGGK